MKVPGDAGLVVGVDRVEVVIVTHHQLAHGVQGSLFEYPQHIWGIKARPGQTPLLGLFLLANHGTFKSKAQVAKASPNEHSPAGGTVSSSTRPAKVTHGMARASSGGAKVR